MPGERVEDADKWRFACWQMIRERSDLHFLFLTKHIERFMDCIPEDGKSYTLSTRDLCSQARKANIDY